MKDSYQINTSLQQLLSAEQAYQYRIVPTNHEDDCITFKTDADLSNGLQRELEIILGKNVLLEAENSSSLEQYLSQNYRQTQQKNQTQLSDSKDLLNTIIQEAKGLGSSDIHFEIFENIRRVRFRIDGKLLERYVIPKTEYPKIINQLKVKSGLDIAEKRLPQDGRINYKSAHESYDIRVSSLPTLYGEKLVLRLLSKDATNIQLEKLGFNEAEYKTYTQSVKNQSGIILISGPTGSGKTTIMISGS